MLSWRLPWQPWFEARSLFPFPFFIFQNKYFSDASTIHKFVIHIPTASGTFLFCIQSVGAQCLVLKCLVFRSPLLRFIFSYEAVQRSSTWRACNADPPCHIRGWAIQTQTLVSGWTKQELYWTEKVNSFFMTLKIHLKTVPYFSYLFCTSLLNKWTVILVKLSIGFLGISARLAILVK